MQDVYSGFAVAMMVIAGGTATVSYTHLDVYKRQHIPLSSANTRLGLYKRKSGDDAYVTSVSAANPPAVQCLETYKSFPSSVFTSL